MKIRSRITAVGTDRNWSGGARLTVTCAWAGDDFTFRVKDTPSNRAAYILGRFVAVDVQLERSR